MAAYYNSLLSAFPEGNNFTTEVIAEVWAGIVNANQDYMRYVSYLNPVIETNVTVERLAIFKRKYYDLANAFRDRLVKMLNTTEDKAYKIQQDVLFFAPANAVCCYKILWFKKPLSRSTLRHHRWIFTRTWRIFLKCGWRGKNRNRRGKMISPSADFRYVCKVRSVYQKKFLL